MKRGVLTKVSILLIFITLQVQSVAQSNFLSKQKKYDRVNTAYIEKGQLVAENLKAENILTEMLNILVVIYKNEKQLVLYAKNRTDMRYHKIKTYSICASSGHAGPKRKQGDMQVPEGFYYINDFNPQSNFYLSLGINYPNPSDLKKTSAKDPGGAIYIHGNCVTIGCVPVTDDKIKELYIYAIQSRQNGQRNIPVYIFPFKMTAENIEKFTVEYSNDNELLSFWENIKPGFDKFEREMKELKIGYDKAGNYQFK